MATRYWVGGTGTWNGNSPSSNWSATSGGASGVSAPTTSDDVIFNSASSGASYIVSCSSDSQCKSITTAAPAVGTLTFSGVSNQTLFIVAQGNINIHAACLFTGDSTIQHNLSAATTVTFNGPGVNTQNVGYLTNGGPGTSLNFCSSQTATFRELVITAETLICTSAVLSNWAGSPAQFYIEQAASITMTGTTINMNGSLLTIAGTANPTWAISTLAVNVTNCFATVLSIGETSTTQPSAMGAVTFTNCTGDAWFARASALTLNSGSNITLATNLTTSGALTVDTSSRLNNPSFAVSIGGITTLAGDGSIYSTSNSASTTFTGAVTIANRGINPADFFEAITALGTFVFSNGVTLTPTGTNSSYLLANIISADAITATNTFINATTSLTVNGGVGKAFSYTVNTSAIPVNIIRQTTGPFVYGTHEYPCISAKTASITTPTTSFVGTNVRRVVYGQPRSSTKIANDTLTISGSTPTLTNVTFLGTSINGGASNYSGTRLGTDGLSNGFLPATGVQKFVVTAVAADFATAIWALTSGGATSANNYPLPQDTIIYDSGASGSTISYAGQLHIGTVNMSSAGVFVYNGYIDGIRDAVIYCYGSVVITATGSAGSFGGYNFQLAQSGLLNRYLTNAGATVTFGIGSTGSLLLDAENSTALTMSGNFSNTYFFYALSGTNEYLNETVIGPSATYLGEAYFYSGSHTMRGVTIYAAYFTIYPGVVFPSSRYTVYARNSIFDATLSYTNNSPTTALNGSYYAEKIYIGAPILNWSFIGTSSTNPLKSLTLTNLSFTAVPYPVVNVTQNIYVEALTNGANVGWTISGGGGVRGFVKTNGGTASIANVFVNDVIASPLNTFFATGTSTLTGTTTGWTLGAAPASPPPSGGFLFF